MTTTATVMTKLTITTMSMTPKMTKKKHIINNNKDSQDEDDDNNNNSNENDINNDDSKINSKTETFQLKEKDWLGLSLEMQI